MVDYDKPFRPFDLLQLGPRRFEIHKEDLIISLETDFSSQISKITNSYISCNRIKHETGGYSSLPMHILLEILEQ